MTLRISGCLSFDLWVPLSDPLSLDDMEKLDRISSDLPDLGVCVRGAGYLAVLMR